MYWIQQQRREQVLPVPCYVRDNSLPLCVYQNDNGLRQGLLRLVALVLVLIRVPKTFQLQRLQRRLGFYFLTHGLC